MATWVLAEFTTPEGLLAAVRQLRERGHEQLDTHSPYPLHGADEALGLRKSIVPLIAFVGGMTGLVTAFVMQFYPSVIDYDINVGNRPALSPTMVPIVFELGILFTGLAIFGGLMLLFGFPRPHHPVFEVDAFRSASSHAFWVSVETRVPRAVQDLLRLQGASFVTMHEEPAE